MGRTPRDEQSNDDMTLRAPRMMEVIGPAGVGKTTLAKALRHRHGNTVPDIDIRLSKLDKIPFVISNTLYLLPTYLREYRHSRWFDRRETRSMAYLRAGLHLLGKETPRRGAVTILDHGPIYRLAFLREFGPEITTSHPYRRWWASLLEQWADRIDFIVLLDAPETVLLERIRARGSWHTVRDKSDSEAYEILRRYRGAFERTIAEALAIRRIELLRIDTSQRATEEIVVEISEAFARANNVGRSRSRTDRRVAEAPFAASRVVGSRAALGDGGRAEPGSTVNR